MSEGILDGIRIIDLSQLLPGPLATMYLGDWGAEVIKIENPRLGDGTRYMGSDINGQKESPLFGMLNRNKKSLTLNLKREEGKSILMHLLRTADVLIEGFRPQTMKKMGLSYEDLKEKFPRLIYISLSGYGATGKMKSYAGHDGNYTSWAGLMHLNRDREGRPVLPAYQIADIGGGSMMLMTSVMAALFHKERTGKGQYIDIAMADGAISFLPLYLAEHMAYKDIENKPQPNQWVLSGALPNYNIYETRDGQFVMLAALEERFFRNFLKAVNREDILQKYTLNKDNFEYIKREIVKIFKEKDYDSWQEYFHHPDICLSPIANLDEVVKNEHFQEREMFFYIQKKDSDGDENKENNNLLQIGNPIKFSSMKEIRKNPPPNHGSDTVAILNHMGYSKEEIESLKKKNIIS